MPTLYLIDGYAQFFRAYHAIRTPMSSPVTKEPTNMTFGFVGMLLKLFRAEGSIAAARPEYVAVALDVSDDRGTFRSTLYPEYKATRPPPPEDLAPQVERCLNLLRSMQIPIIGAAGYEADDAIAAIVARLKAERPDVRVRIISKDKDLKQLLDDNRVELFDIHTDLVIDEAALRADTGLRPDQIVDFLALMGDTVDNVPGVDGVGPKTAAELIATFGSLDAVLAETRKDKPAIKGKRLENIRAADAAGQLPLAKQLVTLRPDTPIEFALEACNVSSFNFRALAPALRELGFNRFQDELATILGEPRANLNPVLAASNFMPATTAAPSPATVPATPKAKPRSNSTSAPDDHFGGLFAQRDTDAPAAAPIITPQSGTYRCITTAAQLRDLIDELRAADVIAIDTETRGLYPMRDALCGVCLSTQIGTGVYVPVRSPDCSLHLSPETVLDALRPILEDPTRAKCGHNLKFDMLVLRAAGVRLAGFFSDAPPLHAGGTDTAPAFAGLVQSDLPHARVFDSMVASYLIDADRSSHGLDALALALLSRTNISLKDLIGSGPSQKCFDQISLEQATQYAAEDADVALQLRAVMLPQLAAMGLLPLFERVEMPLVEVLAELEWNGIRVDRAELDRQRARLQSRIDVIRTDIDRASEDALGVRFNPDSPKQLAVALFNPPDHPEQPGLGIKPLKRTKTGYSTDVEVLEQLASDPAIESPIPRLIVEHRQLTKLVGTYLAALADEIYPDDCLGGNRIHASFNQTVAATGRLSSSDPNLQNIPIRTDIGREIRRAFIAEPGCTLVTADYSQIELRLLAHLSRDPALIQAFLDGQDIHTAVAAQIHNIPIEHVTREQRSGAKMVNFGIVYGITAFGLARRLGVSNTEADQIISGYKKRFAGITTFLQECVSQAQRFGYVETMLGRRRPIPDIDSTNPSRRSLAERVAINSVVQGSAADLIKLAMVDIHAHLLRQRTAGDSAPLSSTRMLLQIHDELVFECPLAHAEDAKAFVKQRMESAMTLRVPLIADAHAAPNWFDGK